MFHVKHMGTIVGQDEWLGQVTRIYVRYDHPDPDWEHDPDIAEALRALRKSGHAIYALLYYTTDPSINKYDVVIARRRDP